MAENRVFLGSSETPQTLVSKCAGLTDVQAKHATAVYVGKWLKLSGFVHSVRDELVYDGSLQKEFECVRVTIDRSNVMSTITFVDNIDRLKIANINEFIVAEAEIFSVGSHGLSLKSGRLLEIMSMADAEAAGYGLPSLIALRRRLDEITSMRSELAVDMQELLISDAQQAELQPKVDSGPDQRPQLARSDAEKFSRALLSEWPDATEDHAHKKAALFFAENRVPRDWFRDIFRAIRGPKSRGKQPLNRN